MSAALVAVGAVLPLGTPSTSIAEAKTKVYINGKLAAVHFNDGDSFRVLSGTFEGRKARLAGYNTLESYGPVHQWGDWTEHELYVIAKMATLHARRNVWECTTDGALDTYGRMLLWCPDLAADQIRRGYAHAMSINDDPAETMLLEAQREAIEHRRGIWSHGVPEFVLTSLHSADEDVEGRGTYNRLVSSEDGHSVKWKHEVKYDECDKVCHRRYAVHRERLATVVQTLQNDEAAKQYLEGLSERAVRDAVRSYAEHRHVDRHVPKRHREGLQALLLQYAERGDFGPQTFEPGACMTHVPFTRRFGGNRAECLNKH